MADYLDRLHHVAIQVEDIQESVKWYTNNFSCEVEYHDNTWAMIQFENTCLALTTKNEHPSHFAIEARDITEYQHLGDIDKHRDDTKFIYVNDPSHNTVEIISEEDDDELFILYDDEE